MRHQAKGNALPCLSHTGQLGRDIALSSFLSPLTAQINKDYVWRLNFYNSTQGTGSEG